ncbi:uncharacterized protein Tco025E_05703 [Trypanosoma conorhini]|uniref:Uncharacterized protein n=1 Tax=Trypanosoma conorhini TaxID=83891 RepID=A0A3R7LIF5_9TRYP|nr:uncharacterized protein Tco025E_05703 [Trypanosoma conorhini]RNF15101.1 hypothetical protein Tco025E_05703 [Trypanosoma conorhini]
MFLSFSVEEDSVRPFMHLLHTVSKQGEGVFFEPHRDMLQLRVVNSTRSTHMLVTIAACHLKGYRYIHRSAAADSSGQPGSAPAGTSSSLHDEDGEFYLLLPTKALTMTVLRQSQGLGKMHVRYDPNSASVMAACDTLQWECVLSCGTTKSFALPLAEGRPERAFFAPERFLFDACGEAWLWGALLGWFPASRPRVVVQPLKSRLELWVVDNGEADATEGAHPPLDGSKSGGAETKVVASQEHFRFMQLHAPQDDEPHGEWTTSSRENGAVAEARASATGSNGVLLPGKIIELKPFKQVCMLAHQLGLMIRVRTGGEGLPVFVEAITAQAASLAAKTAATDATTTTTAAAAAAAVPVFSGNGVAVLQQNTFGKHLPPADNAFQVTFSMYLAAFDVPQRAMDGGEGLTATSRRSINSVTTVAGEDRGVAAAGGTHEAEAPVAATCFAPLSAGAAPPSGSPQQTLPTMTATTAPGPDRRPTCAANGTERVKHGAPSPPGVLVPASLGRGSSGLLDGPSQVNATPSRGGERALPSAGGEVVVGATPDAPADAVAAASVAGGGAVTPRRGGKRPRGGETVDGASPQQTIVSCTAVAPTATLAAQSASFVAPTNVSSSDRTQAGVQQREEGPTLSDSARPSMGTRLPLDFNAFMQEIAEEAKEEEEEEEPSEEDEDLQRFLDSCISLFVQPSTQTAQSQ